MINLVSYFLFNLANVILILFVSSQDTLVFLNYYSIGNGVFTFFIFYNFSKKNILKDNQVLFVGIFLLTIYYFSNANNILILLYVFLLLYSDYYYSQSNLSFLNFILKLFLLLTSFLIIYFNLNNVLLVKVFLILFFLCIGFFKKDKFKPLKVKSPIIYIAAICIIYHGALFLISIIFNLEIVKILYILLQLLIGIKLRLLDLKIRDINIKLKNFDIAYDLFALFIVLLFSYFIDNYLFLLIFLVCLIILNYVKKRFIFQN
jgi:hypothetical protein